MFRTIVTFLTFAVFTSPLLLGGKAFAMTTADPQSTHAATTHAAAQHGSDPTLVLWLAAGLAVLAVAALAVALAARRRPAQGW